MRRLAAGLAMAVLAHAATFAAAAAKAAAAATANGHSDLSGVWSNASVTWLDRRYGLSKLVLTEAEARALEKTNPQVRRQEDDNGPVDVSKAPPVGNPGGYNAFWLDPGGHF